MLEDSCMCCSTSHISHYFIMINSPSFTSMTTYKIFGDIQGGITTFCEKQVLKKARSNLFDDSHVLYPMFETAVRMSC